MAQELHSRAAELAPLYNAAFEHDACGVGLVVDIHGRPARDIVTRALAGLVNLTHRGGVGADERTGDGAGILTQIPIGFFAPDLAFGELGVAMTFLPQDAALAEQRCNSFRVAVTAQGLDHHWLARYCPSMHRYLVGLPFRRCRELPSC